MENVAVMRDITMMAYKTKIASNAAINAKVV
jgi:hypothetical protein